MNGQFKRCAQGLQQAFPNLKIEGGPYTPPPSVQYFTRAIRTMQVGAATFFFAGEQIFGKLGRRVPPLYDQMHDNKLATLGGIYGLDVLAQTAKSINAFEITFNGNLIHSKLATGQFPNPADVVAKLAEVMMKEQQTEGSDGNVGATAA